VLFLR